MEQQFKMAIFGTNQTPHTMEWKSEMKFFDLQLHQDCSKVFHTPTMKIIQESKENLTHNELQTICRLLISLTFIECAAHFMKFDIPILILQLNCLIQAWCSRGMMMSLVLSTWWVFITASIAITITIITFATVYFDEIPILLSWHLLGFISIQFAHLPTHHLFHKVISVEKCAWFIPTLVFVSYREDIASL